MKTPDQFRFPESSEQSRSPHPHFESVIKREAAKIEKKEKLLAFDRFVEETVEAELERFPFVEAVEPALPQEDAAGADFFAKLFGVGNPLAIDVTVSANPQQMKEKLSRIGKIYRAKIERDDALIAPLDETMPIKMAVMFLDKKDFAPLYNRYAKASFQYDWQAGRDTQEAIMRALLKSVKDFYDKVYGRDLAAANRQFNQLLVEWNGKLGF